MVAGVQNEPLVCHGGRCTNEPLVCHGGRCTNELTPSVSCMVAAGVANEATYTFESRAHE